MEAVLLEVAVERWAASRGARELVVNSGTHRHEAHRFYEGHGFRVTGIRLVKDLQHEFVEDPVGDAG